MYVVDLSGTVCTLCIKHVPECCVGPDPDSLQLDAGICRCVCPPWAACAQAGWLGGTGFTGLCNGFYNYSQWWNTDTNRIHSCKPGTWLFSPSQSSEACPSAFWTEIATLESPGRAAGAPDLLCHSLPSNRNTCSPVLGPHSVPFG